jgi:hypothetical protein
MSTPAEGIKDLLVSAGLGTFAGKTGWGIYLAKEPDGSGTPHTVITVIDAGGFTPNPKWLLDYPTVQVRVRGAKNDYIPTYNKARSVRDALLGLPSQDVNGERWVAVNAMGGIHWLGFDDQNRPIFTLNFRLILEPASGTHRAPL